MYSIRRVIIIGEYTVYVHICPNGKRYYGSTKQDVKKRWRLNGDGYKNQPYFWEAIEKYGWSNIQHIIVAKELSKEEAKWLEIELIKEFDTTNLEKGYNIVLGDATSKDKVLPEEIRKKISKAKIGKYVGKNNPKSKSVICITTKRIFLTVKEGAEYYGTVGGNVTRCCQGKQKSAGKYKGEKLIWRYLVWNHNKTYRIKGE